MPTAETVVTPHTKFEDLPEKLSVEEFRAYLHLSRAAAYARIASGDVPSKKYGRSIRIPKEVVK